MKVEAVTTGFVHDGLLALSNLIEPFFPLQAKAVRDELTLWTMDDSGEWRGQPRRMTDSRWNRVADIICSLAALPGALLTLEANRARLKALCVAEAPRAMARHCFGGRHSESALDLALFIVDEAGLNRSACGPQPFLSSVCSYGTKCCADRLHPELSRAEEDPPPETP